MVPRRNRYVTGGILVATALALSGCESSHDASGGVGAEAGSSASPTVDATPVSYVVSEGRPFIFDKEVRRLPDGTIVFDGSYAQEEFGTRKTPLGYGPTVKVETLGDGTTRLLAPAGFAPVRAVPLVQCDAPDPAMERALGLLSGLPVGARSYVHGDSIYEGPEGLLVKASGFSTPRPSGLLGILTIRTEDGVRMYVPENYPVHSSDQLPPGDYLSVERVILPAGYPPNGPSPEIIAYAPEALPEGAIGFVGNDDVWRGPDGGCYIDGDAKVLDTPTANTYWNTDVAIRKTPEGLLAAVPGNGLAGEPLRAASGLGRLPVEDEPYPGYEVVLVEDILPGERRTVGFEAFAQLGDRLVVEKAHPTGSGSEDSRAQDEHGGANYPAPYIIENRGGRLFVSQAEGRTETVIAAPEVPEGREGDFLPVDFEFQPDAKPPVTVP